MTALLEQAFKALDSGTSFHDFGLVCDALIASGDAATLEARDPATELGEAYEALVEEAEEIGSNWFVVLDFITAYSLRRNGKPAVLRRSGRRNSV